MAAIPASPGGTSMVGNGTDERILFAVPKKGRLHERVLKLLEGSGLEYRRVSERETSGWAHAKDQERYSAFPSASRLGQ
jgi:hypothetical protein